MEKNYQEINFNIGDDIESAIKVLEFWKSQDILVCGEFNGIMLYSDIDDIESAYEKIVGTSKSDVEKYRKEWLDSIRREELEHEESIPRLTKEWIEKGEKILDSQYLDLWKECVPIRLNDLYRGFELGACLEIVTALNDGCKFDEAKILLVNQDHSGSSFGLVCSMLRAYCKRGEEFVNYVRK